MNLDRFLAKAKRVDNGEWVVGFFSFQESEYLILDYQEYIDHYVEHHAVKMYQLTQIPVDRETLCQCTGHSFKNELTFEGDLFKNKKGTLYLVIYDNAGSMFHLKDLKRGAVLPLVTLKFGEKKNTITKIGNKFDNSELLEGE